MYMIVPGCLPLHSYRACLPLYLQSFTYEDPWTSIQVYRYQQLQDMHHNKKVIMNKNNNGYDYENR